MAGEVDVWIRRLLLADWELACLMQGTPYALTYETEFGPRLWVASMQRVP